MYQPPLCKNDRCSKLVPPSKNAGVPKLFCEPRCARRFHSRQQYSRDTGAAGSGMLFVNSLGQAQVNRRISLTSKAADARLRTHLTFCGLTGGPCPSRTDPYGRQRQCLVGAVLSDDWSQLKDTEEGKPVRRYATSQDGRWLVDLSTVEKEKAESPVKPTEYILSPEEREEAYLSGALRRPEGLIDEALARYNEGLPMSS